MTSYDTLIPAAPGFRVYLFGHKITVDVIAWIHVHMPDDEYYSHYGSEISIVTPVGTFKFHPRNVIYGPSGDQYVQGSVK